MSVLHLGTALQQYPAMEAHLSSLCQMMAIEASMGVVWHKELTIANGILKKKGVVAYRKVDFEEMNTT